MAARADEADHVQSVRDEIPRNSVDHGVLGEAWNRVHAIQSFNENTSEEMEDNLRSSARATLKAWFWICARIRAAC